MSALRIERGLIETPELELLPPPAKLRPRYLARPQYADRHVVIPDLHGEYKVLDKIVDEYWDEPDIDFVFLGDLLDRKGIKNDHEQGVFRTLDTVKELGNRAVVAIGNHEWMFLASTCASDPAQREVMNRNWLGTRTKEGCERNVLSSYNLDPEQRDHTTAKRLRRKMERIGHMAVLTSMVPYFETEDFIATHAGVALDESWEVQREYLDSVAEEMRHGDFHEKPEQWFSMKLATTTEPIRHTHKVVVSGHAHALVSNNKSCKNQSLERVLHDGKRIRLASSLNPPVRAPAYIWQDWDGQVVEFPQDGA